MGCGPSKEGGKDANSDEIKSDMKHTKVAQYDEFFRTAREVLEGLEELRGSFQETRETMNDIGRTDELVDPKFSEALRVFFWSVSAHSKGEIKNAGIRFETDPPALTVDCGNMHYVTWEFSDALMKLIGGFTGAPGKILDITQKVKEISEQATELSKDIKGTVEGAGLNVLDKAKAIANAGINFKTVAVGVAKAPKVLKEAQEALNDIKEALPQFKELIAKADEVGKKAHEKGTEKIDEIFDHFQTAAKKTPEQIKEEKKDQKKKPRKVKKPASKPAQHKPADHKPEHKSEHKPEEHKPEQRPEEHKPVEA